MIYLKNEEMTYKFGKKLGKLLGGNDVVTLNGDLGAGKTTMTKAIAEEIGVDEPITSPTFTIVQEYEDGRLPLYHFDVYRIADPEEMYYIGFDEYLSKGGIVIIEWAGIINDVLPRERLDIELHYSDDGGRVAILTAYGKRYENIIEELIKDEDFRN